MDRLRPGLLTGLPLVLLLGGCFGDIDMAPFGRSDAISAPDSLTARRVMGTVDDAQPLETEPGNVWPTQEAPRATLQNPEAVPPRDSTATPPARPRRQGSSEALPPLDPPPLPRADVPRGAPATPPEPRVEGRVIPVPGGPPATITGGAGNIQTFTQPGIGTGTAIRQNGSTILMQPDGSTVVVPTP
ncbi:hypothetical protein [Roseomonas xinghualingensis]|uniref:hypothetical protein n=1 Tax=Roseomonas xinghualingensis TaxID=2986475 RepID=UPI0021F0BAE8|nr:hypothetical protein [Roseomonas sp. SXEYE001]MCV4207047.1 hypothetical protein [Roseomonas sp. SXEYE001]